METNRLRRGPLTGWGGGRWLALCVQVAASPQRYVEGIPYNTVPPISTVRMVTAAAVSAQPIHVFIHCGLRMNNTASTGPLISLHIVGFAVVHTSNVSTMIFLRPHCARGGLSRAFPHSYYCTLLHAGEINAGSSTAPLTHVVEVVCFRCHLASR